MKTIIFFLGIVMVVWIPGCASPENRTEPEYHEYPPESLEYGTARSKPCTMNSKPDIETRGEKTSALGENVAGSRPSASGRKKSAMDSGGDAGSAGSPSSGSDAGAMGDSSNSQGEGMASSSDGSSACNGQSFTTGRHSSDSVGNETPGGSGKANAREQGNQGNASPPANTASTSGTGASQSQGKAKPGNSSSPPQQSTLSSGQSSLATETQANQPSLQYSDEHIALDGSGTKDHFADSLSNENQVRIQQAEADGLVQPFSISGGIIDKDVWDPYSTSGSVFLDLCNQYQSNEADDLYFDQIPSNRQEIVRQYYAQLRQMMLKQNSCPSSQPASDSENSN